MGCVSNSPHIAKSDERVLIKPFGGDNEVEEVDSIHKQSLGGTFDRDKSDETSIHIPICWQIRDVSSSGLITDSKIRSSSRNSTKSRNSDTSVRSVPKKSLPLMKKLEKLKVSSKRGRPKKVKKQPNKFFEIPERYKIPPIETKGLTGKDLEAHLILETGENLGLTSVKDRSESLKVIKSRLLS